MNSTLVDQIANALLYEGYILYPYRASAVKNKQRFNFGVLAPRSYSEAQGGFEAYSMQTECLVLGDENSSFEIKPRFLHLLMREVCKASSDGDGSQLQVVESLEVDGRLFQNWQEAVEREVKPPAFTVREIASEPRRISFSFPSSEEAEQLRDANGNVVGKIIRRQQSINGAIELEAVECDAIDELHFDNQKSATRSLKLFKLTVRILNLTWLEKASELNRDNALMSSLVSAHTILGVRGGEFISLLEPSEEFGDAVASCNNMGAFPVLVGENGERNVMLSSPIILYDYPQIAPESAGDLFDGTEIDEILMLRIMTLTEDEKREMRHVDERARRILERTENMPAEQFWKMHGAMRSLR